MGLDWTTIKPVLTAVAATCTGIPARMVIFDGAQEPTIDPAVGAIVKLRVYPIASIGSPDVLWKEGDAPDPWAVGDDWGGEPKPPLVESIESAREVNLQIKVECFIHTPGSEAETFLERAVGRFRFTRVRKLLLAVGLGFSRCETTQYPTTKYDQRIRSVGVLDVKLYAVNVETDGPYDAIETAEVTECLMT